MESLNHLMPIGVSAISTPAVKGTYFIVSKLVMEAVTSRSTPQ